MKSAPSFAAVSHSANCLITHIRAALDAATRGDNEAIRKMLEEIGGPACDAIQK